MPVNVAFDIDSGGVDEVIVQLDRWAPPDCTIFIEDESSDPDITIEGTGALINQGQTAVWSILYGTRNDVPDVNALFEDLSDDPPYICNPVHAPLTAIRVSVSSGTCQGRVIQGAPQR